MSLETMTALRDFLYVAGGGFAVLAIGIVVFVKVMEWLIDIPARRDARTRRQDARSVLRKHGLTPRLYLPRLSSADDELEHALTEYATVGYVVFNAKGEIVGTFMSLTEPVPEKPGLRLVVSNG